MELELSAKTTKKAKERGLSCEQMAFADLVAVGWEQTDAYIAAFRVGATWIKKALKTEVEKLMENKAVLARIDEVKTLLREAQIAKMKTEISQNADEILERATNKEMKLISLQTILEGLQPGSKEYNKINDQIFAITQMKRDEVVTDDRTVHYHLPIAYPTGCKDCLYSKCDSCKYKKAYKS